MDLSNLSLLVDLSDLSLLVDLSDLSLPVDLSDLSLPVDFSDLSLPRGSQLFIAALWFFTFLKIWKFVIVTQSWKSRAACMPLKTII